MSEIPVDFSTYQCAPDLLAGRVILVTGATGALGSAAARAYAAHGATVILLGRSVRKLEMVYDSIEAAGHPQPAIYPMNLEGAAPKDYDDLAATLAQEFGRLDGILHSAGRLGHLTPLGQYRTDGWVKVMQVNLNAPFLLTAATLDLLKASPDASVVFTGSDVGRHGRAYWGAYAISNAAVENMMQIWADELETNTPIRVNSLDPGAVRSDLRARAFPGEDPRSIPRPDDVMGAYLWLMGPDSRGVTGRQILAQKGEG